MTSPTPEQSEARSRLTRQAIAYNQALMRHAEWRPTGKRSQDGTVSERIKALLIPQNTTESVRIVDIAADDLAHIESRLRDVPTTARYDRDAIMYVGDSSLLRGLPRNDRATQYVHRHSDAAARGHFRNDTPDSYYLAGDVFVVGDDHGEMRDVPEHIVASLEAIQRGPERVL